MLLKGAIVQFAFVGEHVVGPDVQDDRVLIMFAPRFPIEQRVDVLARLSRKI